MAQQQELKDVGRPPDEDAAGEELSFGDAMGELEDILERIEGEEIDVDRLAAELGRAAELLDLCRAKIRRAEVEVTQIVQDIEADEGEDEGEDGDGDGG